MGWVKIRDDILADNRLGYIAHVMEVPVHHVLGLLVMLWLHAHRHGKSTDAGDVEFTHPRGRTFIDTLALSPVFFDELKGMGWVDVDEKDKTVIRCVDMRKHIADGMTVPEREERREQARVNDADRQRKCYQSRPRPPVTPEKIRQAKANGVSDAQMRHYGWLKPGETSEQFLERCESGGVK